MNSTDFPVKSKQDRPSRVIPPATQSENVATTPNVSGARRPTLGSPSLPATSHSPEDEAPLTEVPLTKDVPFTEEDIETLEEEYPDIVDVPPAKLVYAWEAFAKKVSGLAYHSCCSMRRKTWLANNSTAHKAHSRRLVQLLRECFQATQIPRGRGERCKGCKAQAQSRTRPYFQNLHNPSSRYCVFKVSYRK